MAGSAPVAVRTLAFLVLRRILGVVGGPTPDANDVEIAVLRHQLAVLRRQVARPRYTPTDRMVLATLAKLLPRDRWKIFLVTPSTLLRWHRELIRRRWTYPTAGRRGGLDPEVVELVLRLARDNPRWGYMRIVGLPALVANLALELAPIRVNGPRDGAGSRMAAGDPSRRDEVRPGAASDPRRKPMRLVADDKSGLTRRTAVSTSTRQVSAPRRRLRHPAEVPFYIFMVVLNVLIIATIIEFAVALPFLPERIQESGWGTAIRSAFIALLLLIPGLIVVRETQRASVRGTAVQLSPRQYSTLYRTVDELPARLGLRRRPQIYLANGNGTLNAFAAQATGYDYVVLANELFVNLHRENREGLEFILGHELGRIRLHHVSFWYQLSVAYSQLIPLLGPALSRLREYSCDRHGATYSRWERPGWCCWPPAGTPRTT